MYYFLRRSFPFEIHIARTSPPNWSLDLLQNPNVFPLIYISTSSDQQSFTVSYLVNSLGFSPKAALSASKHVNFSTAEKPDKVIDLFKKYGFTQTQISSLVRISPVLLSFDAEKTILPKLEFLKAKGFWGPEMTKRLSVYPSLLRSSLDNQIIPGYDFFRNFLRSDEKVLALVKRFPDILRNIENYVEPNIAILRGHGVPDSNIVTTLMNWPIAFMLCSDRFRKIVEKAKETGIDTSNVNFVLAVKAFQSMSESTWESKVDAYKKWGWSEEEVMSAFRRNPWCMMVSKDKLMESMDFFINQMGWSPSLLAKCPTIIGLSLKKRVVPRCSVFQLLLSKGWVEKEVGPHALLIVSEEKFLRKFVVPYEEQAPDLLKLYKKKLALSSGLRVRNDVKI